MILFALNCDNVSEFFESKEKDYPAKPVFYSADDEGPWEDKSGEHVPYISLYDKSKNTITVAVPLVPVKNPKHYIEFIALMKDNKEIDVKRFDFTFNKAVAEFKLPDRNFGEYRVVAKCNLHDMWDAPIIKK